MIEKSAVQTKRGEPKPLQSSGRRGTTGDGESVQGEGGRLDEEEEEELRTGKGRA